jgi:hypothetical protein
MILTVGNCERGREREKEPLVRTRGGSGSLGPIVSADWARGLLKPCSVGKIWDFIQ